MSREPASPNGWRSVRFGEVAESITQRVDDPATAGVQAYVGLEHLDQDSKDQPLGFTN